MLLDRVELHYAMDRRCYNGAPCSDLAKEIKSIEDAKKHLKKYGLNITYFPNGGYYIGFKRYENKAPEILTRDCTSFDVCYDLLCIYIEKKFWRKNHE